MFGHFTHPFPGHRFGGAAFHAGPRWLAGCGPEGPGAGRCDAAPDSDDGSSMHRGGFGRFGRGRGPGPFGPPGRRGGRMFGQGDLRLVVLHLIAQAPRHGYELIKAIEDGFGGQYAPSPGAIYPTLSLLEEQDLIAPVADSADAKKRFRITAAGDAVLAENRAVVDGVLGRMRMAAAALAGEMPPESVFQAMHTLKHALALRRGHWSAEEAERVSRLILAAAEAIVRPAGREGESVRSEGGPRPGDRS